MADVIITKSLALTDETVVLGVVDNPMVGLEVSGTWTGTLNIESSVDPDSPVWAAAQVFTSAGAGAASTMTANGRRLVQAIGVGQIRVRFNPASSGIAVVTLRAGDGSLGGGGGGGGGGAATISDGGDVAQGSTTDAGITTDSNGTVIGFLRGAIKMWIAYLARFPAALGGTTSANSLPVVLSSDGPFATQTGSITETAPATDTASSGLNGRLQRIAQRVTSLIALIPAALTGSGNFKVSVAESTATVTAQGGGANQAAVVGNPNWIAGSTTAAGGNTQGLIVESAANPNLRVGLYSGTLSPAIASPNNGISINPALATISINYDYNSVSNGATFDRHLNNVDTTPLASASRTTTQTLADITTYNLGALKVFLDMTVVGTGSVTVTINEKDPASAKYILLLSGAAITTNSTNEYVVDPAIPAVTNVSAQKRLTRIIQIVVTANNANAATYSLGYALMPC